MSVSQVLAAGTASVCAALVTSRLGATGTLIGAAMTTMLVTGGSAILRSYLESISGRARNLTGKVRDRSAAPSDVADTAQARQEAPVSGSEGMAVYGSEKKQGFFGRLRSAFEWFKELPSRRKRSILLGAAVPAVIAFVIAMVAITGIEFGAGKPLSCVAASCQTASSGGNAPHTTFGSLASGGGGSGTRTPQDPGGGFRFPGFGGGADGEQYSN